MKKPKIIYAFDSITETTTEILHDLGYHVVLFEPGTVIRPGLIKAIEEKIIAYEQAQSTPTITKERFFIDNSGETN